MVGIGYIDLPICVALDREHVTHMYHRTVDRGVVLIRVYAVVAGLTLSGQISLDLAAIELGTSPRALHRRLSACGIKSGDVGEETQFGITGALLRKTKLGVQGIAARIGCCTPGGLVRDFGR